MKIVLQKDVEHVLRMVLSENRGNVLTEAMVLGIHSAVQFYLDALPPVIVSPVGDNERIGEEK